MALALYDHGYRIQTPVSSVLPNRTVEQLTEMHNGRGIPSSEHQVTQPEAEMPTSFKGKPLGKKAQQAYKDTEKLSRRQSDQPNFLVNKIMTKPVISIRADSTLTAAWDLMNRYQIQHLAVLGTDGRLMGVITERDLLRRNSPLPHAGPIMLRNDLNGGYSSKLIVATPDTLVRQAALVIFERKVSCIPIIETDGRLVGMVTRSDLLPLVINDRRFEQWA